MKWDKLKMDSLKDQGFKMHPLLNIAITAARNAGNLVLRFSNRVDTIKKFEKMPNDFVTEVDQLVEQEIIQYIRHFYPHHGILAEESGQAKGDEYVWIIDPIDGTTNFIHGFPHFAISIALQCRGRLEHGVIYDPVKQELFYATRGAGAFLNDHRIRVSQQKEIKGALMGTGFPFCHQELLESYLKSFKAVSLKAAGIRRTGSAALDLAYVAAGRLDGFWELKLSPWDIAAGAVLIREAGGFISDFTGAEKFLETGNVVAGTPKVFKELLPLLSESP
jgi:myo-inositol-1(or 4)-monophosphatase